MTRMSIESLTPDLLTNSATPQKSQSVGDVAKQNGLAARAKPFSPQRPEMGYDSVAISPEAVALASQDNSASTQSERAEKVATIKQMVSDGRYQVNAYKIAEELLKESLLSK